MGARIAPIDGLVFAAETVDCRQPAKPYSFQAVLSNVSYGKIGEDEETLDPLAQLTSVHDELLANIQKLETATRCADPDRSQLALVRWKLTRASRARWQLLDKVVYPEIERRALGDRPEVVALRTADAKLLALSSNHIARWDTETVVSRWPEYQAASSGIVASMRGRVGQEQSVLYPLLANRAG